MRRRSRSWGERWARRSGYARIVGCDEVGRGPLAGPVVAAAVMLPPTLERSLKRAGLDDSKKLSAKKRETLAARIRDGAIWGMGLVPSDRVDAINVLQASLEAMRIALEEIASKLGDEPPPDCILVDGNQPIRDVPFAAAYQKTIVQGDGCTLCIAAASVIAKVHRDALMVEYDAMYPGYGFAAHKGYRCRSHWDAIDRLGPCPIHRRSFRGIGRDDDAIESESDESSQADEIMNELPFD